MPPSGAAQGLSARFALPRTCRPSAAAAPSRRSISRRPSCCIDRVTPTVCDPCGEAHAFAALRRYLSDYGGDRMPSVLGRTSTEWTPSGASGLCAIFLLLLDEGSTEVSF